MRVRVRVRVRRERGTHTPVEVPFMYTTQAPCVQNGRKSTTDEKRTCIATHEYNGKG